MCVICTGLAAPAAGYGLRPATVFGVYNMLWYRTVLGTSTTRRWGLGQGQGQGRELGIICTCTCSYQASLPMHLHEGGFKLGLGLGLRLGPSIVETSVKTNGQGKLKGKGQAVLVMRNALYCGLSFESTSIVVQCYGL